MAGQRKTRLDPNLLSKIAENTGKPQKYIREQISKRASRLSITSEAAQVLWAKELGIGTAIAFRRLDPHIQEQVQAALPSVFASDSAVNRRDRQPKTKRKSVADPIGLAIDYLLIDDELKSRCKDLLKRRRHFDTVFREATTVLEDRIRTLSGLGRENPEKLVNNALNPDPNKAILVISNEPYEQQGFHSICRGIVLAFRHKAHHHLDDKISREDALKFCAFIDVLLDIIGQSKKVVRFKS